MIYIYIYIHTYILKRCVGQNGETECGKRNRASAKPKQRNGETGNGKRPERTRQPCMIMITITITITITSTSTSTITITITSTSTSVSISIKTMLSRGLAMREGEAMRGLAPRGPPRPGTGVELKAAYKHINNYDV